MNYNVIEIAENSTAPPISLVRINLLTGRSHQIRVQFSNENHFVIGDVKYGRSSGSYSEPDTSNALALWAHRLEIAHPVSKERISFLSFPPAQYPWTEFKHFAR